MSVIGSEARVLGRTTSSARKRESSVVRRKVAGFPSSRGRRQTGQGGEQAMQHPRTQSRRRFLVGSTAAAIAAWLPRSAFAADPVKIGLILPLTGPFASTGRQTQARVRLDLPKDGDTVARP